MTKILLNNASVFDGLSDELRPGVNVLVVNTRIEEVSDRPIQAQGAVEFDLAGRALLPGLIDAHVHVFAVNLVEARNRNMALTEMTARAVPRIRAMLDRGFTSVRDVAGGDVGIRDAIAQGFIPGPRLFVGGPAMGQIGGHGDHRSLTDDRTDIDYNSSAFTFQCRLINGPEDMRRAVRNEMRKGVDHIKVMASGGVGSPTDAIGNLQFTKEELEVAVHEASVRGKYVCAHAYTSEAIRHAVGAGVRTAEHANMIDADTARFVAERGAYVVPTLVCYEETAKHGERLGLSAYVMEKLDLVNRAGIDMLGICTDAGVKLGFGTDLMGEMEYAQSDEFAIRGRVQKPADVLRSATSVNAEILQQSGRLGVIAPGAIADLIVCDGDPLRDISLLSQPHKNLRLTMKDGAIYRTDLAGRER